MLQVLLKHIEMLNHAQSCFRHYDLIIKTWNVVDDFWSDSKLFFQQ